MFLNLRAGSLTRGISLIGLVLAGTSVALPVRAADPEAEELFRRGSAELEAASPDYEEAHRTLRLAYEKSRDFRVLASLAHAAEALERDGEAIQAYAEYLARGGAAISEEERVTVERALRALRSNVARVTLLSSTPDLVLIDSRVGAEAPPQLYHLEQGRLELELRPGTHLLTAVSGVDRLEWQIDLAPGDHSEHLFEFRKEPRASHARATNEGLALSTSSTLRIAAISVASVGSAALVAGAVTGLLVIAKEEDARSRCRKGPLGTVCPESARDDFETAKRFATATNILLVGGGVTAIAGLGTLLFATQATRSSAKLRVLPELGARSTGLHLSGVF